MLLKIQPTNYQMAYNWFNSLPFYTFMNLIKKEELSISNDKIQQIEIAKYEGGQIYFIHYDDKKYFGKIQVSKLNNNQLENFKITYSNYNKLDQVFHNFTDYKHMFTSPITFLLIYFLVIWYSLTSLKHFMFPEFSNPTAWVTTSCDANCIVYTSFQMYSTIITFFMTYGAIAVGILLLWFCKKKSNLLHYKKSFDELRLFFTFFGSFVLLFTWVTFSPSSINEYKKIYLVRFDQEYKHSLKGREIASKIEGINRADYVKWNKKR